MLLSPTNAGTATEFRIITSGCTLVARRTSPFAHNVLNHKNELIYACSLQLSSFGNVHHLCLIVLAILVMRISGPPA